MLRAISEWITMPRMKGRRLPASSTWMRPFLRSEREDRSGPEADFRSSGEPISPSLPHARFGRDRERTSENGENLRCFGQNATNPEILGLTFGKSATYVLDIGKTDEA
jgi:hypothetical protein